MPAAPERIIRVGPAASAPTLSVLTPFYRYDPSALIAAIGRAPADVEFILLDDGSSDTPLLARLVSNLNSIGASGRVIVCGDNRGRAVARNRLIQEARGAYVLFLDADMLPGDVHFLERWLELARTQNPEVAFGGLSLCASAPSRETALHHNLFGRSDCHSAAERVRSPAQSTASSNLLVRRDFLTAHPFDPSFAGWGFEDTDWALTASRHTRILHIDNPAIHVGLDGAATLLRKSAEAGPNFARLVRKHPAEVSRFAAYRAARALRNAPRHVRSVSAWMARNGAAPMVMRRIAFKLHRATHFAEHLS